RQKSAQSPTEKAFVARSFPRYNTRKMRLSPHPPCGFHLIYAANADSVVRPTGFLTDRRSGRAAVAGCFAVAARVARPCKRIDCHDAGFPGATLVHRTHQRTQGSDLADHAG